MTLLSKLKLTTKGAPAPAPAAAPAAAPAEAPAAAPAAAGGFFLLAGLM